MKQKGDIQKAKESFDSGLLKNKKKKPKKSDFILIFRFFFYIYKARAMEIRGADRFYSMPSVFFIYLLFYLTCENCECR